MLFRGSLGSSVSKIISHPQISSRCLSVAGQTDSKYRIGFIGLGNMGWHMAKNLLLNKSDHMTKHRESVTVYDVDKTKVQSLEQLGALSTGSIQELARNCNYIVTMLPATQHVEGVLLGTSTGDASSDKRGVFDNAAPGTVIIDCSTIDPTSTQELHRLAKLKNLRMLDAPVSGGVTGAAAGTLTFMVGGEESDLLVSKELLSAMGKNVVSCGGPGAGGITKLCNNLSLAISMIGTSEAMALGVKMGLDPKQLAGVINTSTGRCWSSEVYNPVPGVVENVPSSNEYKGGFGVALMEKDLGLAMSLAQRVKSRSPLGVQAHQLYGILSDHGYAGKDFSSIFQYLSKNE